MILYLNSTQNKLAMLLPSQAKEQYISLNVATGTTIIAHVITIWKMYSERRLAAQID